MALYHAFSEVESSNTGVPLPGVKVVAVFPGTGEPGFGVAAPIYQDMASTPFPSNECYTDETGMYSFYIEAGSYNLDFFIGSQFIRRIEDCQFINPIPTNVEEPYRATLSEAIEEFPIGFYFRSDDKNAEGPHPNEMWIYQRIGLAPFYVALVSNTASMEKLNEAIAEAQAAAAVAIAASNIYPTTTAGLAATADGEFFSVAEAGATFASLYQNVSGSAVLKNQYPSKSAVDAKADSTAVTADIDAAVEGIYGEFAGSGGGDKVGLSTGDTAETAIQVLKQNSLSIASVCQRGSSSGISAANKTALQALLAVAVTEKKSIYIPSGDWYIDGGIECLTGLVSIQCDGNVYTNTTTAWLTMKVVGGTSRGWYIKGGKFVNTNSTQSQKGSSIIAFQSDGSLILSPNFIGVEGYGFYQMFDNSAGTYTTSFGNEGLMNHGLSDGCVPHYYGALNAKYVFRHRTGSGTGWVYRNCRDDLAVGASPDYTDPVGTEDDGYPAYVRVESGGINAVVSDCLFDGHVSGKFAGAISIDGDCEYRSNISMGSMSQVDAQARRAIFFDPQPSTQPVLNFSVMPLNVGGDIDIAQGFPRSAGSRFHAQGFGEAQGGRYDANLAGPGVQSVPLCKIQMQQSFGCLVELWATGDTLGVATGGLRKRVYAIQHNGTAVTVTDVIDLGLSNPSTLPADFFDFSTAVASDEVTISVRYSATGVGSKLQAQYRVHAGAWKVTRLQ